MTTRRQIFAVLFAVAGCADSPTMPPVVTVPSDAVLQEMESLVSEKSRLRTHHPATHPRVVEIDKRLAAIEQKELGPLEQVAAEAILDCSELPQYGEASYGIILHAVATAEIKADELLLFHADRVHRTRGLFRTLKTTGEGWYFRAKVGIPKGERFVVACIQDAAEEIQNVQNGFMPNSDRARDPARPYKTRIYGSDGKPIPPPPSA